MRFHAALFVLTAVAQAIDVDWTTIDTMQLTPPFINPIACGAKGFGPKSIKQSKNSRIVGGEEASPGQFPYQVAVLATVPQGTAFCGGSILHEEWVLTAAHCVDDATSVELIMGAHNVVDGDAHQFRISVANIIVHEDWDRSSITDDIALLKLTKPLSFTDDRVQPVYLPSRSQMNDTFADETAIVSGWGKDSDSSTSISPVLRWTSSLIMENEICTIFYFFTITGDKICLSGTGGRSACNGDSGGPLVYTDTDGKITQIGIVSYGIAWGCAFGWPGVYTRMTSYVDWIEKNTYGSVFVRDE